MNFALETDPGWLFMTTPQILVSLFIDAVRLVYIL